MTFSFSWNGLPELRKQLLRLPNDLKLEATRIVIGAAHHAHREVMDQYPDQTGNLKRGLTVTAVAASSNYGARMRVRTRAHHSHLFEKGTKVRQTKKGANRGRMRGANVFIPTMIRNRNQMYRELYALVRRQGFTVRVA